MSLAELVPCYTKELLSPFAPREAVHIIVQNNLRRDPPQHRCSVRGNGNRAAKREAVVRSFTENERQLREIFDGLTGMGLTPSDVDRFAEQWTESRTLKPRRNLAHP